MSNVYRLVWFRQYLRNGSRRERRLLVVQDLGDLLRRQRDARVYKVCEGNSSLLLEFHKDVCGYRKRLGCVFQQDEERAYCGLTGALGIPTQPSAHKTFKNRVQALRSLDALAQRLRKSAILAVAPLAATFVAAVGDASPGRLSQYVLLLPKQYLCPQSRHS